MAPPPGGRDHPRGEARPHVGSDERLLGGLPGLVIDRRSGEEVAQTADEAPP